MKQLEHGLEYFIFASRWLLAPFYVGLIVAIAILLFKFMQKLFYILPQVPSSTDSEMILAVLTLVDISLVANLLLMVTFAGYENFVSKIDFDKNIDRPEWMGKVDYSGLKIKLIASIVAISGIELLKAFVNVQDFTNEQLAWKTGIHLTFVVSGVMLVWMDKIAGHGTDIHDDDDEVSVTPEKPTH